MRLSVAGLFKLGMLDFVGNPRPPTGTANYLLHGRRKTLKMNAPGNSFTLIQKKGVAEILHSLRFVPKRYNSLRQALSVCISSRTLDARLKNLLEGGFLYVSEIPAAPVPGHEYALTSAGIFLEALVATLSHPDFSFDRPAFHRILDAHLGRTDLLRWETIWPQLKSRLLAQGYIETIKQHKHNAIVEITDSAIMVQTEKGTKPVELEHIKHAWANLLADGVLAQNDYEKASYRSAFIIGLFALLDCVHIQHVNPVIIELI
jgi:DNA-binding HxlR family transcriptional regulator